MTNSVVFHSHVQVCRGDTDIRVANGVTNLGQGTPTCEGVADKRVSPVVDRQRFESLPSQHLAGSPEALPECVARERLTSPLRS
jgi:hypothetical protein